MKLRVGDNVKIVAGKDKGRVAKIQRVFPKDDSILVEGANQYKRHIKGRMQGQKSEIITLTKPLSASSVSLICPNCKRTTRVGYRTEKGKKIRFCRKCAKAVEG